MRIGKINFVFRSTGPEQHRLARDRFRRATWTNLVVGVICGVLAAVTGSTVLWGVGALALVVSLMSWGLALVPAKLSTARDAKSRSDEAD